MATYYWVGGDGNWDATSTTNWATSSGGAGGSGVPTSLDDVVFDVNSNTGTNPFAVTVTGDSSAPALCRDFTASGLDGVMTFTSTATSVVAVYGSLTFPATSFAVVAPTGSNIQFKATSTGKTIATNGNSINNFRVDLDGVGGEWTLGSALSGGAGARLNLINGSFITDNYNITLGLFNTDQPNVRSLNLGSSTITATVSPTIFEPLNLSLNAGTSILRFGGTSHIFRGGGLTYYDVQFTSNASGTSNIFGANTFNNLSQTSRAATGTRNIAFDADQVINGTLTLGAANTAIRRVICRARVLGLQQTITLNGALATLADVDFRGINVAGTVATPWTGTRLGDCLGNSGITFDAPKNVYRVGTGNWSATQWATSSGGAVNVNNFPLAQDTMVFDANTTTGTHTIDQNWQLGAVDCSAVTAAITIASGTTNPVFFKNITLDSDVTLTGTGTFTLAGQGTTQSITSAGVAFTQSITVNSLNGIVEFLDAVDTAGTFTITEGTVKLKSGATSSVLAFETTGTTQKFLQSTLAGSQATLSQTTGTVSVSYLTIQDINATGGATWDAFTTNNNVDAGNNLGWDFSFQLGKYIYTRRKNKRILP